MRILTSRPSKRPARTGVMGFVVAAFLLAVAQPACATTWGHLRGPFSAESQQLERANYAAEERSICREWGANWISAPRMATFRRHAHN